MSIPAGMGDQDPIAAFEKWKGAFESAKKAYVDQGDEKAHEAAVHNHFRCKQIFQNFCREKWSGNAPQQKMSAADITFIRNARDFLLTNISYAKLSPMDESTRQFCEREINVIHPQPGEVIDIEKTMAKAQPEREIQRPREPAIDPKFEHLMNRYEDLTISLRGSKNDYFDYCEGLDEQTREADEEEEEELLNDIVKDYEGCLKALEEIHAEQIKSNDRQVHAKCIQFFESKIEELNEMIEDFHYATLKRHLATAVPNAKERLAALFRVEEEKE